jgi:hypothetical protein
MRVAVRATCAFAAALPASLRATLAGLSAALAATTVLAQAPNLPTTAQPSPDAPYVDRVMDAAALPEEGLELKTSEYNSAGWPRSLRVDYSVFSQSGAGNTLSRALGLGGFLDTPNYGALSINANLTRQRADATTSNAFSERASTWRIDQRALPLDSGWRANHSAGDINTGSSSLARGLGRVSIPTTPIRGLSGQWYLADSFDLNAAAGRTGLFNGLDLAGFQPSGGRIASAGAQFRLASSSAGGAGSRSDAAFQLIDGRDISDIAGFGTAQDTRAVFAATSWEGAAPWGDGLAASQLPASERPGGLRLQGNVVKSSGSRDGGAVGLWADAAWRGERWRNTAGVFRFEPNLRWGTAVLPSDLQGAYWQADTSTRQWQAGFATELSDSVSGAGLGNGASGRSAFLNLHGRYRLDTRNSLGAALNLRGIGGPGQALLLSWDQTTDWGQTLWRSDLANTGGSHTARFGVDQSWPVIFPNSLNTSLAWERVSGGPAPGTGWIWGLLGAVSPVSQWSLDASLRGAQRSDGAESLSANIGLRWQSFSGWSVGLRYTEARGREPLSVLVVSALTASTLAPLDATPRNRSVQLVLRYEAGAGSASAPIGGVPGSGAGTLSGTVFFDADANGRREASEAGVPGVTVILDLRYVTRTDVQGRYEFPSVAAGQHLIEVSADNVPLPWSPALREPVKTSVLVRQISTQDFAVQRDR